MRGGLTACRKGHRRQVTYRHAQGLRARLWNEQAQAMQQGRAIAVATFCPGLDARRDRLAWR
ncbi:MAG TPA: hypothetical protein DIV57_17630 [Stenotrophomonas sp.]|nr:hypothetical protein [Stenotrophomonas sp.]